MTIYSCMQMFVAGDHVNIVSTDIDSFQAIGEKAKELVASARWKAGDDVFDGPYRLSITHLKKYEREVFWGLLQFLCESGWEPFSVKSIERDDYQRLWLRKVKEG